MRELWAVTRTTFLECLRSGILLAFVGLLGAGVVGIALNLDESDLLKSRIRTFLAYGTGVTQVLLGLVTVFLSTLLVSRDIRRKTVFTVASKPLARWKYVLGRWGGIVLMDAALLALATGGIYAQAQYLRSLPTSIERKKAQGKIRPDATDLDRLAVEGEIFTARARRPVDPFDVEDIFKQRYERLVQERGLDNLIREQIRRSIRFRKIARHGSEVVTPEEVNKAFSNPETRQKALEKLKATFRKQILEEIQQVRPGQSLRLTFSGLELPPDSHEMVQVRYRLRPLVTPESRMLKTTWAVEHPKRGLVGVITRNDSTETACSLLVPPEDVYKGTLTLTYFNTPEPGKRTTVKLPSRDIAAYYRVGTFGGNLVRAALLILLRLMFLAAAGVTFGVFLSFPVACLCCLLVLGLGVMAGFIQDATRLPTYTTPRLHNYFTHYLAQGVFLFLPSFARTSPVDALVDGEVIPTRQLLGEYLLWVSPPGKDAFRLWKWAGFDPSAGTGPRALLLLATACLIFRRRELARVQV